jgi:hypothetical protein
MRANAHFYEFKYALGAFLSALFSCTEHSRLFSNDPRFKGWYRDVKATYLGSETLARLFRLRNVEVHQQGTDTLQRIGFETSEDRIETTHLEFTIDFSQGTPTGTLKTAEMPEAVPVKLTSKWVWDTPDSPDVIELCSTGVAIVSKIIDYRNEQAFVD